MALDHDSFNPTETDYIFPHQRLCNDPGAAVGADVFCASARIIAELEERLPEPSIYPGLIGLRNAALDRWTASICICTTINSFQPCILGPKRFTLESLADPAGLLGNQTLD